MLGESLAELRAVVARCNPDLVLCDYRKSKLWRRRSFFGPTNCLSNDIKQLVQGVFRSRKMYCWVKISRRSLWLNGPRFPDGRVFEDVATTPWLLLKVKSYYYVPKAWIYYRKRTGSIMDSVRRRPGHFDEAKHEDLAQALIGYPRDLENCFGPLEPALAYPVADFCAKEFTKTASRIKRAEKRKESRVLMSSTQTRFRSLWQACSPIPFERLTSYYLKRLRFIRYGILRYFI